MSAMFDKTRQHHRVFVITRIEDVVSNILEDEEVIIMKGVYVCIYVDVC